MPSDESSSARGVLPGVGREPKNSSGVKAPDGVSFGLRKDERQTLAGGNGLST